MRIRQEFKDRKRRIPYLFDAEVRQYLYRFLVAHLARKLRFPIPSLEISDAIHMKDKEKEMFLECISRAKTYLEYGSGGSILYALKYANIVVSVENDLLFLSNLEKKIALENQKNFVPLFVYTGLTLKWGKPFFEHERYGERYSKAPWQYFETHAIQPDFVLIDGRYRVASVLESLLNVKDHSSCVFMIDDYKNRDYSAIEPFIENITYAGHAISFKKTAAFDELHCRAVLKKYLTCAD